MLRELTALGAASGLLLAGAAPAAAATGFGCDHPRVCFYLKAKDWGDRKPTASYRAFTDEFQILGPRSRGAYAIYNSRADDAALLLFSDGTQECVEPDGTWFHDQFGPRYKVVGVQIIDESDCAVVLGTEH
ncbi:hypothetical protein Ait01nite_036820 [Actinoplanes italicus]|uniref:Peptidase inhibitor family I36 n=1 Tax=Actinoplanes italicus TaxID=113567 RepID=A0A2T0K981_9ACTN|nr:hypothetical protein [Actinoplanes italicus]PRX19346.1 hypothetical protein CLV67_11098 [Actinoplanes italicus]GIE30637.1 hypothetical protein Ait01nite_036820 [Actinoplanes italicus]